MSNVSFYNADAFLHLVPAYRSLWIKGHYGGGKTLLSFALARWLCEHQGYRYILSNMPSVWSERTPDDIVLNEEIQESGEVVITADAIFILDEGGLFMRFAEQADQYLAFLRKLNIVVLCPSVMPVSMRLRSFTCKREYDFSWLGFPIWIYSYKVEGEKDSYFAVMHYSNIYGVYSTVAPPSDDAGLSIYLKEITAHVKKRQQTLGVGIRRMREIESVSEQFASSLQDGGGQAYTVGPLPPLESGDFKQTVSELQELTASQEDYLSALSKIQKRGNRR